MPGENFTPSPAHEGQPEGPYVLPPLPDAGDIYQPIERDRFAELVGAFAHEGRASIFQVLALKLLRDENTSWKALHDALEGIQQFDDEEDPAAHEKGYMPPGSQFLNAFMRVGIVMNAGRSFQLEQPHELKRYLALSAAVQEISDMYPAAGAYDILGDTRAAETRLATLSAIYSTFWMRSAHTDSVSFTDVIRQTALNLGKTFSSNDEWVDFFHKVSQGHIRTLSTYNIINSHRKGKKEPSYCITVNPEKITQEIATAGNSHLDLKKVEAILGVLAQHQGEFLTSRDVAEYLRALPGDEGGSYRSLQNFEARIGHYLSFVAKKTEDYVVRKESTGIFLDATQQKNFRNVVYLLNAIQHGDKHVIDTYASRAIERIANPDYTAFRHYMQKAEEHAKGRSEEELQAVKDTILSTIINNSGSTIQEIIKILHEPKGKLSGYSYPRIRGIIAELRREHRITFAQKNRVSPMQLYFNFDSNENEQMLGEAEPDVLRNAISVPDPVPGDIVVDVEPLRGLTLVEEGSESTHEDEIPEDDSEDLSPTRRGQPAAHDEQNREKINRRNNELLGDLKRLRESIGPDEESWEDWQRANYVTQRARIITQLAENNRASIAAALRVHFGRYGIRSDDYRQDAETLASFELVVLVSERVIKEPLTSATFGTYLYKTIINRLHDWHYNTVGTVRLPLSTIQNARIIMTAIDQMTGELERRVEYSSETRIEDIVEKLSQLNLMNAGGKPFTAKLVRRIIEAMQEFSQGAMLSIDTPTTDDGAPLEEIIAGEGPIEMPTSENDLLAYIRGAFQRSYRVKNGKDINQGKKSMEQVMEEASRDAEIIFLRVIEEKKSGELAERYGIDPDKMYRIINEGLNILRDDPQLVAMLTG